MTFQKPGNGLVHVTMPIPAFLMDRGFDPSSVVSSSPGIQITRKGPEQLPRAFFCHRTCHSGTRISESLGLGLKVHGGIFAATVNLKLEVEPVAFVERRHAGTLDSTDVHERVRLAIVTLNEAEALHRVEELDRAAGLLARELPHWAALGTIAAAGTGTRCIAFWTIRHRQGLAIDLKFGRGDLAATIDQRELELLALGQTGQTGLLNSTDVNEYVFAAIVTDNEAETLLAIEELDDTGAFANDLGRHAATAACTAAEATTTAAAYTPAAAASTAAEAATTAAAVTVAATTAAAEAAAITKTAAAARGAVATATAAKIGITAAATAAFE
jgi:hypothetical protein